MGSNPLPLAPCTTFRWKYFRQLTVADHTKTIRRPLLRAKTSVGSISAHDIASGSLAQLRERRRGRWRSSWIGFQAVLRSPQRPPLAHPFLALLILRRTIILPEPSSLHSRHWKLWTALPTTLFLASTCGYTSKIIEPPPLPREHRDQSSIVT